MLVQTICTAQLITFTDEVIMRNAATGAGFTHFTRFTSSRVGVRGCIRYYMCACHIVHHWCPLRFCLYEIIYFFFFFKSAQAQVHTRHQTHTVCHSPSLPLTHTPKARKTRKFALDAGFVIIRSINLMISSGSYPQNA